MWIDQFSQNAVVHVGGISGGVMSIKNTVRRGYSLGTSCTL